MNIRRVQSQFEDRCMPVTEAGCWIWTDESRPACRTSWLLSRGAKPARGAVRQTCGNEHCVNPDHLHCEPSAQMR
ncbi:MAG: hypothetical protein V2J24_13535 [Pseudomonadales bacterium]|jgi:hypothetical protein|nr:hypothetical protein [Pseudomonadales bacterium]